MYDLWVHSGGFENAAANVLSLLAVGKHQVARAVFVGVADVQVARATDDVVDQISLRGDAQHILQLNLGNAKSLVSRHDDYDSSVCEDDRRSALGVVVDEDAERSPNERRDKRKDDTANQKHAIACSPTE